MGPIFVHEILPVPETNEETIQLLQEKFAEGWRLNAIQLYKAASDETQPAEE
jgi:hypothetical protein